MSINQNTKDHPIYKEALRESVAIKLLEGGFNPDDIEEVLTKLMLSDGVEPTKEALENEMSQVLSMVTKTSKGDVKEAVLEFIGVTDGVFRVTDCVTYVTDKFKELQKQRGVTIVSNVTRGTIRVILHRLKNNGVIEKAGIEDGKYRKVINVVEEIDIFNADSHPLDIHWPFRIQDLVHTYQKSLIVVAGEPNAGKTAFLLNVAIKKYERFKITYFSSEMGAIELRQRIEKFKVPLSLWKNIRFIERASDFSAVIEPDGFNIIDFMEIHDNFYVIGGWMKQIFDKLDKGVAVIAIQKNKGRDTGRGGEMTMEKPRLYLTVQPGLLKIVKGKNWVSDMTNPNGLQIKFKLGGGCNFVKDSEWHKAE